MAAIGIIGRERIGYFDTYVEGGTVIDEFTTLTISLHDGREDTLKGKAVTGIGEHDEALGIALRGRVAGQAVVEIRTYDDIGTMAA